MNGKGVDHFCHQLFEMSKFSQVAVISSLSSSTTYFRVTLGGYSMTTSLSLSMAVSILQWSGSKSKSWSLITDHSDQMSQKSQVVTHKSPGLL